MALSNLSARFFLTQFAALGLMLTVAQGTDPAASPNSNSATGAGTGTDQPPADTRVPATISDAACGSGQRNVVKIYRNGTLVKTERGGCVT